MKIDLEKITEKFYKDEDRLERAQLYAPFLNELILQIGDLFSQLALKGYRLMIFHLDPINETMYAALTYCCGANSGHIINNALRKEIIEPTIIMNTRYKKIVWEDIIQAEKTG